MQHSALQNVNERNSALEPTCIAVIAALLTRSGVLHSEIRGQS
jgi:hypothetical protein